MTQLNQRKNQLTSPRKLMVEYKEFFSSGKKNQPTSPRKVRLIRQILQLGKSERQTLLLLFVQNRREGQMQIWQRATRYYLFFQSKKCEWNSELSERVTSYLDADLNFLTSQHLISELHPKVGNRNIVYFLERFTDQQRRFIICCNLKSKLRVLRRRVLEFK